LFAAFVSLRNEVDVALVFDFRRASVFFTKNLSSFESGFNCNVKIVLQILRQKRPPDENSEESV